MRFCNQKFHWVQQIVYFPVIVTFMKLPQVFVISLSLQVKSHFEIMENIQSKNFMSYIETVNKLSRKENFGKFCNKKAKRGE